MKPLKIFTLLLFGIFLISMVSAASVIGFLFYDSTDSNSLTIIDGSDAGIIVSADSIYENSMSIRVELLNSNGNLISTLLSTSTANDEYSNYLTLTQSEYSNAGNYIIRLTVTGASGQSDTYDLTLEVTAVTAGNTLPVITSTPVTQVNENQAYNYQMVATDADGDALTYSLTQKPTWLSISASGLISGTAPSISSDYQFVATARVSDGKDFVTQTFAIDVINQVPHVNTAPVAQAQSVATDFQTPVTITLSATDADGDSLVYSVANAPSNGAYNLNQNTGIGTYTPNAGFSGSDSFTFRANDGQANSNVAIVTVTVNPQTQNNAPVITSTAVTQIGESQQYNYDVEATDADNDVLTYSFVQNPSWLSIDSASGLISGTAPSVSANTDYDVEVSVSDGNGGIATQFYTITVTDSSTSDTTAPVITILGNNPENVVLGTTYTDAGATALDNVDGDLTSQIQLTSNVDTNTVGTYLVVYSVSDVAGNSASETRTVNVYDPNDTTAPVITVVSPISGNKYASAGLIFEIETNEPSTAVYSLDGGANVSMNETSLNVFESVLLTLSDGAHSVTFYVTDIAGNTASATVDFSVDTSSSKSSKDKDGKGKTVGVDEENEQTYLSQSNPKTINLSDDEEAAAKKLNFWQKIWDWLMRLFGFR